MFDPDWLVEIFSPYGRATVRRMFGGQGVHLDGLMVALVAGDVLYLKSDAESAAAFDAEGLDAFAYTAKGERRVLTSYRRCPPAALDDSDEMRPWVELARAAALRAAARKQKGGPGRRAAAPGRRAGRGAAR